MEFDLQSWHLAFKIYAPSSHTGSVLFRFLTLFALSLLTIPKLHGITHDYSIFIELDLRDASDVFRKVVNSINISDDIDLQVAISVTLREKLDESFFSLLEQSQSYGKYGL